MRRKAPKYFHYFLTCLLVDFLLIGLVFTLFFESGELLLILSIWLAANIVNYPRVESRRYISYYKVFGSTARQLIAFLVMYILLFLIFSLDDVMEIKEILALVLVIFLGRSIYIYLIRVYRIRGRGYNRFIMIGNTPTMIELKDQFLSKKEFGYVFEGIYDTFNLKEILELIIERKLNEVYCSSVKVQPKDISHLMSFSVEYGVNVHVITDSVAGKSSNNNIFFEFSDVPLERFPLLDTRNLILKRILDFFFALFITLTVLPIAIIVLGVLIRIDSKGSIFYKQARAGRSGKYFHCYKFRSMKLNFQDKQATRNDERVTKVGRFIRKTSLDELPQFFNVLIGDMSIVGPRPHIKALNDKFSGSITDYDHRLLVKPGITGLSQITGYRGETNTVKSMEDRIRIDMQYIKNWSLYLDLMIIYKTTIDFFSLKDKNVY
ncbi:exopolysaccharide biosynthesis polyprenyl glycosylphosphotransferase [Crocinitomix catalasitica]|uniref:exopolysaccharide biosynthesis polyprenyl glycosylphosphotransferase n=1 Tax=Crocinitomix catalasitica TaxID=184607 RepID=UPI0004853ABA|nr:exopolysaccharide biosynthesis polyprenyl glycosylphosphotransferase [Crocinitomix catalasitica]